MKKLLQTLLLAVVLFASGNLFAQNNVYLNLGGALPLGDFADGDDDDGCALINEKMDEGGAGFGLNAGLKLKFGIWKGLGVIATMDGIYNGLNSEMRDLFEDVQDEMEEDADDFTLRKPKYINVPLMVGANYTHNFNSKFGVYGEFASGVNFRFITPFLMEYEKEYSHEDYEFSLKYEYKPAVSFAWQLGAGIELANRITLGMSYYNLGSAKVEAKIKEKATYNGESDSDSENFKGKRVRPGWSARQF